MPKKDSIVARIFLEVSLDEPIELADGLKRLVSDVGGLANPIVEGVSGDWNLMMTVEADSIKALSELISDRLKAQISVNRTSTFVASSVSYWDWQTGLTPQTHNTQSAPEIDSSVNVCVLVKTDHSREGGQDQAVEKIRNMGLSTTELISNNDVDIIIDMPGINWDDLHSAVYDEIGKMGEILGTETYILIPRGDDDKYPFPDATIFRSAYFRISAPTVSHDSLVQDLEGIPGIEMARGVFGLYDAIAIANVKGGQELNKTIEEIKNTDGVERVETLINKDFIAKE